MTSWPPQTERFRQFHIKTLKISKFTQQKKKCFLKVIENYRLLALICCCCMVKREGKNEEIFLIIESQALQKRKVFFGEGKCI